MKRIIVLLMLVTFTVIITGCKKEKKTSNEIILQVWESEQNISHIEKLCNDFAVSYKKQYPDSPNVKCEFTPYNEGVGIEKLALYGPTGEGADVVAFVHDTLGVAVEEELLAPNMFVDKYEKTHIEGAIQAASINGTLYGFPITAESQVIFYDKRRVNDSDVTTIETLLEKGKKLLWKIDEGYYSFSLFNDAVLFGEDGATTSIVNLATTNTISNIEKIINLPNYQNIIMEDINFAVTLFQDSSGSDRIDAVISTPYLYEQLVTAIGKQNVGMAKLPTLNGKELRPYSGYKLYGVSRYSKNPAMAQLLTDYLTNARSQEYRMVAMGLLPTLKTPEMLEKIDQNPIMSIYQESLNLSITMPNITRMSVYWPNFENTMKDIWTNKPNPTDITSKLQALENEIKE